MGRIPLPDGKDAAQTGQGQSAESQDVSCSQSVLPWNETRWIFGRQIADNYIAFQVTARNLNPDQEFLIHDLQVAVADFAPTNDSGKDNPQVAGAGLAPSTKDAGKNDSANPHDKHEIVHGCPANPADGRLTHFITGRDRMLVRGVGQTGQSFTASNITERVLEALSTMLGATATVAGTAQFGSAVHIFSAAGVPGFNKVFPNLNADQIDRLNDLGFTAYSAYKIIIPKSGSVPLTTFLPSRIFADDYRHWHPCDLLNFANNAVVVVGGKHIQEIADQPTLKDVKCPVLDNYLDLSKAGGASGDDFQCQISGADLQLLTSVRLKNDGEPGDQNTLDGTPSITGSTTAGNVTFSLKKLVALAAPQYQVYAESAKGENPTTTRLSLPPAAASVSPAKIAVDGSSGCDTTAKTCTVTITGNNLDLATGVQLLRSSDNSVAATSTWASSSKTGATATFNLADIKKLQSGDYVLGFLSKDGTLLPTPTKITLTGPPGA
jgi:hypothetical protein